MFWSSSFRRSSRRRTLEMGLGCTEAFVAIAAQDWPRVIAFYQALLDQPPQPCVENVYAEFQLPGLRLGIFKPGAQHRAEFAHPAQSAFSLCLEVTDLEEAIAHRVQLGYPPPQPIVVASHGREVYAYDPEGNRLILHQGSATGA